MFAATRNSTSQSALLWLAATAITMLLPLAVQAQAYPNRPVRVVTNYTAGGATDIVARAMAKKLSDTSGQPVVVENRPSVNGVVGTQDVIRTKPDGYNLLFSTAAHTSISRALLGDKMPFDPFRDLTPITLLVINPQALFAYPGLGVKNVIDLVGLAKASPGKYSYASVGLGSPNHLGIELLKNLAGIDMLHVPYKGGPPLLVDLMAGRVQLTLQSMVSAMPQVRAGKLVVLGVGTVRRSPAFPEVATVIEQGYPDFEVYTWYGMFGPAGLPRDIVMKLSAVYNDALKQPEIVKSFSAQGMEPAGGTPEELARVMRSEYERWRKVIVAAKIEIEE